MSTQSSTSIPRHIGVLRMPDGQTWYGPSYLSPDQVRLRDSSSDEFAGAY